MNQTKKMAEPITLPPDGWLWETPASIIKLTAMRRRALIVVGFFGMRRLAELRELTVGCIVPAREARGVWVYVARAKNTSDRVARGARSSHDSIVVP